MRTADVNKRSICLFISSNDNEEEYRPVDDASDCAHGRSRNNSQCRRARDWPWSRPALGPAPSAASPVKSN